MSNSSPDIESALAGIAAADVIVGYRPIAEGDEIALTPEEAASISARTDNARRASGAARIVGRSLLAQLGFAGRSIPKDASGAPRWPEGVSGSFAHDSLVAVAAVGMTRDVGSLGIDVEPAAPLPPETLDLVATPAERSRIESDPYRGRLLFVAKEAVYKAVQPIGAGFLEFHDIEVDIPRRLAVVKGEREVSLAFGMSSHLVALARTRVPHR